MGRALIMKLAIFETVLGGLTVKGSIVGTHQDVVDVFELHRRGKTRVEKQEVGLDDVIEAIEAVLDGSAGAARTVFRMESMDEPVAEDRALTTACSVPGTRGRLRTTPRLVR